ncbi:NOL1/NOP2/sun family protein, partial [Vibrio parahaemolyticus V-223/04]
CGCV